MFSKLAVASALAAIASAATIQIDVSDNNDKHVFSPNSVKAAVGDTIVFAFHSSNIAVRQGTFANACAPASGGFFSAYQIPPTTFSVSVTSTDPVFFYSTLQGHCQEGFAGVINPTTSETIAAYQAKARSVTSTTGGDGNSPIGGTIGRGDGSFSSAQVYTPSGSGSSSSGSSSSVSSAASSASSSSSSASSAASRASSAASLASSALSAVVSSATAATQSGSNAAATQLPAALAAIAGLAALL